MDELAELAPHTDRIVNTQRVWADDSCQQTDYLVIRGHDEGWYGAMAFAKACHQAAPLLKALKSTITTKWEFEHVLRYLPNTDPGLRNQIVDGARLRAGLVIGTISKCRECTEGWIPVGREHCTQCGTHVDVAGLPRCQICTELLDSNAPADQLVHKACRKAAERGMMLGPMAERCLSGKRHRLLMRPGADHGTCINCRQTIPIASLVG